MKKKAKKKATRARQHQRNMTARREYAGEADLMRFEPALPSGIARYWVKLEGTQNGKRRPMEWRVEASSVADAERQTVDFFKEMGWTDLDVKSAQKS